MDGYGAQRVRGLTRERVWDERVRGLARQSGVGPAVSREDEAAMLRFSHFPWPVQWLQCV